MAETQPESKPPEGRDAKGRLLPGQSGNPGGRPKKLVEIERMLDAEHRSVENMRDVFSRLKALATEDTVSTWTDKDGNEHQNRRAPNPAFMALYLERTLGPVKDLAPDLADAPPDVLAWLAEHLN